ncbi:hypothetical protein METHPM2_40033 [Pseudomonas sp. PM2]
MHFSDVWFIFRAHERPAHPAICPKEEERYDAHSLFLQFPTWLASLTTSERCGGLLR